MLDMFGSTCRDVLLVISLLLTLQCAFSATIVSRSEVNTNFGIPTTLTNEIEPRNAVQNSIVPTSTIEETTTNNLGNTTTESTPVNNLGITVTVTTSTTERPTQQTSTIAQTTANNLGTLTTETTQPVTIHTTGKPINQTPQDSVVCPSLENSDKLTQNKFSALLTDECRYDKLTKPETYGPMEVTMQIDIRHIEAIEQLQFKMHILVQYRYNDSRLYYANISPNRGVMLGEDVLRSRIWIPHVVLSNERDTTIMGLEGNDVFVSISPLGEVIFSYRMTAMIYCWMDLKNFPFDEQMCSLHFLSWTYNASEILLKWDDDVPAKVASQLHLTEFRWESFTTKEIQTPAPFSKGAFDGNYSSLVLEFKVAREVGYYIMDYFLPSIMLVCTSWVTFWLQADNAAPRVTLGTATMLSFITLASGQSKTLPKVSYIKVSEIWFLACSMFIFASMVEFAFVNIIWRRRKKVELKKVNSKYILKSTLTPRLARRELQQSSSGTLYKARSCGNLNGLSGENVEKPFNNYLTVHTFSDIPVITTQSDDDLVDKKTNSDQSVNSPDSDKIRTAPWTTMTPQEVAIWIDKRSRVIFPVAFVVFNIFFWIYVFCF